MQVQIIDGRIVINESSLELRDDNVGPVQFNVLDESHTRITSASFTNRAKSDKVSATKYLC